MSYAYDQLNNEEILDVLSTSPGARAVYSSPELHIQAVNHCMLTLWGKDTAIIGTTLESAVLELENHSLVKLLKYAWQSGLQYDCTGLKDPLIRNDKENGLFYDICLQPVRNKKGIVFCLVHTALEVSPKRYRKKVQERISMKKTGLLENFDQINTSVEKINENLAESEARFRMLVKQAPMAITILKGEEYIIELANDVILKRWGKTDSILNKKIVDALPGNQLESFLPLLREVYRTGKAYVGHEVKNVFLYEGIPKEVFLNFSYQALKDRTGKTCSIMVVSTEVTEQVEARKKLQNAIRMLKFSVEAANIGTWLYNTETKTISVSCRLKMLFGFWNDEDVCLSGLIDQISAEYRIKAKKAFDASLKHGTEFDVEFPVTGFHDGKVCWIKSLGSVLQDESGSQKFFSGICIEVTEQKQDEMRKDQFINMVSHELKTPLTSLKGYIQLVHQMHENEQNLFVSKILSKAELRIDKMTALINGFLNVSELEAGKIQLSLEYFDIEELVREVLEEFITLNSKRNICILPGLSGLIYADRSKIGQVITNLLTNASKYSPEETPIEISCSITGSMATVCVRDWGIGISQKDQKSIFDRFYRVPGPDTMHISGFGIGLYLCSEILNRHHGSLAVESVPDKGSVFSFTLPLGQNTHAAHAGAKISLSR